MGSYYVGSYIFFSAIQERQTLIELVLRTMELTPQHELEIWLPNENEHDPSRLPREQALHELAQAEDGGFSVETPLRPECCWFDPPVGPYQTVRISCIDNELDGKINPSGGDLMTRHWLALCEEGQADFGLFGQFEQMIEPEYRDRQLPALKQKDVTKLLEEWPAYWLIYLGPELAARWRASQKTIEAQEQLWLSSGAFFARARTNLYN